MPQPADANTLLAGVLFNATCPNPQTATASPSAIAWDALSRLAMPCLLSGRRLSSRRCSRATCRMAMRS